MDDFANRSGTAGIGGPRPPNAGGGGVRFGPGAPIPSNPPHARAPAPGPGPGTQGPRREMLGERGAVGPGPHPEGMREPPPAAGMQGETGIPGIEGVEQPIDEEQADFQSLAEGPPPVDPMEDPFSQPLEKPIQAHGDTVTILKWREPTAGDIERAGNPIIVDFFGDKPSMTFAEVKMSAMISRLAEIPPSSVRMLTAGDWNAIAWKLVRFFMPRRVV